MLFLLVGSLSRCATPCLQSKMVKAIRILSQIHWNPTVLSNKQKNSQLFIGRTVFVVKNNSFQEIWNEGICLISFCFGVVWIQFWTFRHACVRVFVIRLFTKFGLFGWANRICEEKMSAFFYRTSERVHLHHLTWAWNWYSRAIPFTLHYILCCAP